jgi:hypothetical protein
LQHTSFLWLWLTSAGPSNCRCSDWIASQEVYYMACKSMRTFSEQQHS